MGQELYDTIIIGGGPAGAGAAIYAARKKLKTLLITEEFGGQSVVSSKIENWIGEVSISGDELAAKLEKHIKGQKGLEIINARAEKITEEPDCTFKVATDKSGLYRTKTLILASGGRQKHLKVPGEERLAGRGVAYCSTCDAPFFTDQDVAVVGSGNSAMETVIDLDRYARRIYLVIRSEGPKGDPVVEDKLKSLSRLRIINNAEVQEILGEQKVTGLRYLNKADGQIKDLAVQGVFVAIGAYPNSEMVRSLVDTNQAGEILVNHRTAETSRKGIFAAGNVTDDPYKQNNISAGDGVRAALSAYDYILDIKRYSPCAERGE